MGFFFVIISFGFLLVIYQHGGWTWVLLWPAASGLLLAMAYFLNAPWVFGKRSDGAIAWWSVPALLPYRLFNTVLWHGERLIHRAYSSEPYASQVTPTVWVSRRLLTREIPAGVTCIVDMTCEFPAARGLVKSVGRYHCLPTLDRGTPALEPARALLEQLRTFGGGILIHCAQGHGRSAMMAAALLVAQHAARDVEEAAQIVKRGRPHAKLTSRQRAFLTTLVQSLGSSPHDTALAPR